MKLKNKTRLLITIALSLIKRNTTDFEKYKQLKVNYAFSIKKTDLPPEFNDKSFEIVNEFIRKTVDLDYEILLYFDYITGEIIRCKIGTERNVELEFEYNEFEGKNIASIHNHGKNMYSPPSYEHFGIFLRDWEEYELIAGKNCLWILKGKLKDEKLAKELRTKSYRIFISSFHYYARKCKSEDMAFKKCDELYGKRLSNYINDKNIKEIQLTKLEYNND